MIARDELLKSQKRFDPFDPPALPAKRAPIYEYYRMSIGPDGCPMRRMKDGQLVFHPILIPYLVLDYINLFEKNADVTCIQYAEYLMDHALVRANRTDAELFFNYDPEEGLSSIPHTFFSALTQSWYLATLSKLRKHFPDKYDEPLRMVYRSLLVPIDKGGVLLKKNFGWTIEEYPTEPPLYTLNGWLKALRFIFGSRASLIELGLNPDEFLRKNVEAVEYLLPLYDAKFCSNTRYQLTGFTRLKFVADQAIKLTPTSMEITIPGENVFAAELDTPRIKNRWQSYLERHEPRFLQFNIIQSLVSFPEANTFSFKFACENSCSMRVYVADGDYDPKLSAMPTQSWREISEHCVVPGENHLKGEIPFDNENMFAWPTNFKKKIGDRFFNAYHVIHIIDLAILYGHTGKGVFRETAMKWLEYMKEWQTMHCLADPSISKIAHAYGEDLERVVLKHLSSGRQSGRAS